MQILTYIITGIILCYLDYSFIEEERNKITYIRCLIFNTLIFNIISLGILKFMMKLPNVMDLHTYHSIAFVCKYIIFTLILGIAFIFIKGILRGKISFKKSEHIPTKKTTTIKILSVVIASIGVGFYIAANWFDEFFGDITPEQFLFNIKSPITSASDKVWYSLITSPVFKLVIFIIVFCTIINFSYDIFLKINKSIKRILSQKLLRAGCLCLAIVILICGSVRWAQAIKLKEIVTTATSHASYFDDNYKDPREVKMSFPKKKRNLVRIYLESIENSYLSKDLGGYMSQNLMPELTSLSDEGIHFSNTEKPFGGPHQTYASEWSVAGIVNMDGGMPLMMPINSDSYGNSGYFLPGAVTLGDILAAEGYNQTILMGSDSDFGGLTSFFKDHGNYTIFDYKEAKARKLIPEDYYEWWGFEDDKLYEYAKDELTELYEKEEPFNLTIQTADTHFPDGYLSPNVGNTFGTQYANVIAYSSKQVGELIDWMKEQPFYDNTTIVLTGDHNSMDRNFFKDFDSSYERTIFNLILNSAVTTDNTTNRDFAPFDMFPTVLESLGVQIEGGRLGLGTSLFSKEETLIERDGLDNVDKGFHGNSSYFNDNIVPEDKDSTFDTKNVTIRDED